MIAMALVWLSLQAQPDTSTKPVTIEVTQDVSLEPYEYERESKRIRAILQFFNEVLQR